MKYYGLIAVIILGLYSCNQERAHLTPEQKKARMDSLTQELYKTDLAFAQLSEQKGRNAAFTEYCGDDATMLRPYSMPVTGKDTIVSLLAAHPDSMFKLSWIPIKAVVARSGDLGFTYGTYSLEIKGGEKEGGTYCTVWKKEKGHGWKFALDTGNEGLKAAEAKEDQKIDKEIQKEQKPSEGKKK